MKTPHRPHHANSNVPGIVGFVFAALLACSTLAIAAQVSPLSKAEALPVHNSDNSGAGRIVLDAAVPAGESGELPFVLFDHDAHTRALLEKGRDCTSCHEPSTSAAGGINLDYNFKKSGAEKQGRGVPDYADLKDIYHDGCIGCHVDMRSQNIATGPLVAECRSCHAAASVASFAKESQRADGGLDPVEHYAHTTFPEVTALVGKGQEVCAACHHPTEQLSSPMLDYDSCRSCHGSSVKELSGPNYSSIAHDTCISCHLGTVASGRAPNAPLLCADCHSSSPAKGGNGKAASSVFAQKDGASAKLPRLNSGQPNVVLMGELATGQKVEPDVHSGVALKGGMDPVAFDHTRHEKAVPSCVSCHTRTGEKAGDNVPISQIVHSPVIASSCVGCHETMKTTSIECAGCHAVQPVTAQPDCSLCHTPLPARTLERGEQTKNDLAAAMVAARRTERVTLDLSSVPEVVTIGILSNQYEPSEFPHGRIVRSLARGVLDGAPGFFSLHAKDYTLCQSCHHNSPASLTPPSCASCHATGSASGVVGVRTVPPERPELKAAYHQQCMSCHQRMEIRYPADTDCTACHSNRGPAS